ncbi:MAG: hypothetical protein ABR505_11200 [Actinomycetota bacterium]
MRKLILLTVLSGLILSSAAVPAQAKKKAKPRVIEIAYTHPGIGVAPVGGYPADFPMGSEIQTLPTERYIKIEVTDASGQKVWGFISQGDLNGNNVNDDGYANFCGAHPLPVPLADPGAPIIGIYAFSGACEDGSMSVMTTGTIKISLSAKPF